MTHTRISNCNIYEGQRQYLFKLPVGDVEVFFAAGEIPHRDGGEIWRGALFVHARFYHHRCMASGVGPNIKNPLGNFLTKFSEFV